MASESANSVESLGIKSYQAMLSINHSQKSLSTMLSICLGHCGLTMMQWLIIGVLLDRPQKPVDIAKKIDITQPYVTIVLNQIRDMGFITKSVMEDDGRSKIISISEKGQQKAAEVEARLIDCIKREMGNLSESDLSVYLKVTDFIAASVRHR